MPSSSEIKTLQFMQGVEVTLPPTVLDDFGKILLNNNQANQNLTGFNFDITKFREVHIMYALYRRTDTAGEIVERGELWLSARPEQGVVANKWVLDQLIKKDEGTDVGVTFDVLVDPVTNWAQVRASTTDIAGANHQCAFRYHLRTLAI